MYGDDDTQALKYLDRAINSMRYYRIRQADGFSNVGFGENKGDDNIDGIVTYGFLFFYLNGKDRARANKDDAYFDDNVWIAKEYINAYKLTNDKKYLYEAIGICNWINKYGYVSEGELKGGVYWNYGYMDNLDTSLPRDSRASINVCSMAPHMVNLLEIYDLVDNVELKAQYLEIAESIYAYAKKEFMLGDKLYADNLLVTLNESGDRVMQEGSRNTWRGSYNTATMIVSGILLSEVTGESRYLDDAKASAEAANADTAFRSGHWATYQGSGDAKIFDHHSWRNSLLLEAFIRLTEHDEAANAYVDRMRDSLDYAYRNNRSEDGLVSPSWVLGYNDPRLIELGNNRREGNSKDLLFQAGNAYCYMQLAIFYK